MVEMWWIVMRICSVGAIVSIPWLGGKTIKDARRLKAGLYWPFSVL